MKTVRWRCGVCAILVAASCSAAMASEGGGMAGVGDATWHDVGLGLAAAIAVGLSILGAGYAVAKIGSAALGAAVEKPELLMRSLLFVALAEGLAVLGFAVAMMLIQKV